MASTPRSDKLEKNLILNGNFPVWQRDLSITSSADEYIADRWRVVNTQSNTHSRESSGKPLNSSYFWRTTFAAAGSIEMFQAFESDEVQKMKNKTYTFIFKAKKSADFVDGMQIRIQTNPTGNVSSGGGWTNITTLDIVGADISDSAFQQYKVSFTVPTSNNGFRVNITTPSLQVVGTTLDVAQAMVLEGDFINRTEEISFRGANETDGEELKSCKRFYNKTYDPDTPIGAANLNGSLRQRMFGSTADGMLSLQFSFPTMRAIPTAVVYSSVTGSTGVLRDETAATDRNAIFTRIAMHTIIVENSGGGYVSGNRHSCHVTADAEI